MSGQIIGTTELAPTTASVDGLIAWLRAMYSLARLPEPGHTSDRFDLEPLLLAAVECFSNIARHSDARRPIQLHCALSGGDALVQMRDDASPFDMTAAPARLPDDPLATSGRGLFLIRQSVDGFHYRRDGAFNVHVLRRRIWRQAR